MDFFMQEGLGPFTFFATLVVALLILEVCLLVVGLSSNIDLDADVGSDFEPSVETDLSSVPGLDADASLPEGVEVMSETTDVGSSTSFSIFDTLGLRKVPLTVWLAIFSAVFSGMGIAAQSLLDGIFGFVLPAEAMSAVVFGPAIGMTRIFAEAVGNWIPQTETTAISERSLARRRGIVTVGVARRGDPAEVSVRDQHGNVHYKMLEPLLDHEIVAGTEVILLRVRDKDHPRMIFRITPV